MLELDNITVSYDRDTVLHQISLDVPQGEILCLLGPSGCGKTTLLRTIAGLIASDQGSIRFDGVELQSVPVHERDFGFMFQDFALFPHMNVADNVGFGLKMRGGPDRQARVKAALQLVGLDDFEYRDVAQLSGGEKQRVALARSLAPQPRLLMLDEPLGSLDAALRNYLAIGLRQIIKSIGLTALYVTHDQQEAFAIADRIAILNAGRIEQMGTPEAIYQRPATRFAARFLDLDNIVSVQHYDNADAITELGRFPVPYNVGEILLHPLGIQLANGGSPSPIITANVERRIFLGDAYRLLVQHNSGITLEFKVSALESRLPNPGDSVRLSVDPAMIVPLN